MITPAYKRGCTSTTKDKFYCAYLAEYREIKFPRYLTPTGWSQTCHYFDTRKEAEDTFNRLNAANTPLPVTEDEYNQEKEFFEWYKHSHSKKC